MGNMLIVGISDQKLASPPDTLITYALGSCVGICLHDHMKRVGGMSHILLPEAFADSSAKDVYKFADTAIPELVRQMETSGCLRLRMTAKIVGGANMFEVSGKTIGERNVAIVRKILHEMKIRIVADDTGANYGRTIEFRPHDGALLVKAIGREPKVI